MAAMDIILIKDVENLGYADELVKVKPGYGRNFLIPQKLGVVANESNRKQLAERLKIRAKKEEALLSKIAEIKAAVEKISFQVLAKAGAEGKLFGSNTTHQLAEILKEKSGFDIERRKLSIVEGTVKTLGSYTLRVDLSKEDSVIVPFEVVSSDN